MSVCISYHISQGCFSINTDKMILNFHIEIIGYDKLKKKN